MNDFEKELTELINRHSKGQGSDTPDFILAQYLKWCLNAYNRTIQAREKWFGREVGTWMKREIEP